MEESSVFMIKLKSWNYSIWKSRMQDLLYMKDLHEPIKGDEAKLTDLNDKKWTQLNQKTISTIRSWIDQSVYHHVAKESKTDVLWRKLETIYEQPATQNRVNMMKMLLT